MLVATPETRTEQDTKVVEEAIRIIQDHLDREARNRRQVLLEPKDLCPMQKAKLVADLQAVFDDPGPGRGSFGDWLRGVWASVRRLF